MNGNLKVKDTGPTWTFKSNFDDLQYEARLDGALKASYYYDGQGRRIKAIEYAASTTTTYTLYRGILPLYTSVTSGSTTTQNDYLYGSGILVSRVSGASVVYFLSDLLGNTRIVGDSNANVAFETHYRPFSQEYSTSGSDPQFKFTGQRKDSTGLYFMNARQVDPDLGRFTGQDPLMSGLRNPQRVNRYVYTHNNPVNFVDPNGKADKGLADPFCGIGGLRPQDCGPAAYGGSFAVPSLYDIFVQPWVNTVDWYNHASDDERRAFWIGIGTAVAFGLIIGLSCAFAGCAGLWLLAIGLTVGAGGGFVAGAGYIAAGGRSHEGLQATLLWGGVAASAAFSGGMALGTELGLGVAGDFAEQTAEGNAANGVRQTADGGGEGLAENGGQVRWADGALQHAVDEGHVPSYMSVDDFADTAERIANEPLWTEANPGGGVRAYGIAEGDLEPNIMRVIIGRNGGIITAHMQETTSEFVFGKGILTLIRTGAL